MSRRRLVVVALSSRGAHALLRAKSALPDACSPGGVVGAAPGAGENPAAHTPPLAAHAPPAAADMNGGQRHAHVGAPTMRPVQHSFGTPAKPPPPVHGGGMPPPHGRHTMPPPWDPEAPPPEEEA